MTKKFLAAVCAFLIVGASVAQALPLISVNPVAPNPGIPATDNAGIEVFTFSVAGPGGFAYDTIDFTATSFGPAFNHLENVNGTLNFVAGNQDTDFLGANIFGAGLTPIGVDDSGGPVWTGIITTFGGGDTSALNAAFAQMTLPPGSGGQAVINFAQGGNVIATEIVDFGIPEPGTMALACLGLIGVFASRRRS